MQLNFLQSYLQLLGYDGVNGSHINIGGGAVTVSSRSGIQYESDYSANFSTRSLVDKEYVDARFGAVKLLGSMAGADMNSTADQQITLSGGSRFVVTDVLITNASTDLSANTNDLEIWTGTLRSGDQIARCNVQRLLTPSQFANFSEGSMGMVSEFTTGGPLYLSLGTAHGSAATADVYVYGYVLN